MTNEDLMTNVKNKLPSRQAITATWIQCRYHVLQMQARKCIQDLQDEGLIGQDWNTQLGGYPVLVTAGESRSQASKVMGG